MSESFSTIDFNPAAVDILPEELIYEEFLLERTFSEWREQQEGSHAA